MVRTPAVDCNHYCGSVGIMVAASVPSHCATLISALPTVITLRCMVQFIGRETKYRYGGQPQGANVPVTLLGVTSALSFSSWHSGTLSAFTTIYREEGILGFFA